MEMGTIVIFLSLHYAVVENETLVNKICICIFILKNKPQQNSTWSL